MEILELTSSQEAELKTDLLQLAQTLEQDLAALSDATEIVDLDQPIGRLSRMDAIQQQHMGKANHRAIALRMKQVAQAQKCMEDVEYGFCRRCDEPVGYRRLKARPEAAFCLRCQASREN